MSILDTILDTLRRRGGESYLGEDVSLQQHMLQAASLAEQSGADSSQIAAALLHDYGHFVHDLDEDCAEQGLDSCHEEVGAEWLADYFEPAVTEPIRLHVPAKRYLCAVEPAYFEGLSSASILSLKLQGGKMTAEEVRQFEDNPFSQQAVQLRRWDDLAKDPQQTTPTLEHFAPHLNACLKST